MCGIFGYVGSPERAESLDLETAIHALRHRGPDGNGTFRQRRGDIAIALAHTRLAIIDLSPLANQPMTTEDGRYTLTYNGEVYNFRDVRTELELLGHSFRSSSDSEVVLKAYVQWGKGCVERFRGMFAFAIWDEEEASLFFARDRFGIKPFYYAQPVGGFAFASEVRTLLACGLAERKLSQEGLRSYLTWGSVADPLTMVEGINSLMPAHRGTLQHGKLSVERYWDLPVGGTRDISFDEAVEELRPLLRESVQKELVSDVPLGVFLSGGIDSSAIVAIASEVSSRPIHTFTVTFDEKQYNEGPYARGVAEKYGCRHTEVHLPLSTVRADLDAAFASYDQPSHDGINTWFVARAAREAGLSVALSGLGGDEIFAGYSNFRSFGRLVRFGALARPVAPLIAPWFHGRRFSRSMRMKKVGDVVDAGGDIQSTYRALRCMFTEGQIASLLDGNRTPDASPRAEVPHEDAVGSYSSLELTNYLRNTLLRDSDQMSMAHSLEVRVPFVDHVVVEKVLPLAARLKLGSANKPLLVGSSPALPLDVTHRAKRGFNLPFDVWLGGESGSTINDMAASAPVSWNRFDDLVSSSRTLTLAALGSWMGNVA